MKLRFDMAEKVTPEMLMESVLDYQSMESGLTALAELADFHAGDRVKTLRGSMHGTIVRVLEDGRVVWRADSGTELTALPESLVREQK
jgi:hypothetical protein